jgi:hypothetical protein
MVRLRLCHAPWQSRLPSKSSRYRPQVQGHSETNAAGDDTTGDDTNGGSRSRAGYNAGVHWLTWREIGKFFKSWQGVITAGVALLATAYYGPRKLLETLDWYIDRIGYDRPVLELVQKHKFKVISMQDGHPSYDPQVRVPYTAREIAAQIGRKESSVVKSLRRLEKLSRIRSVHGGWMTS